MPRLNGTIEYANKNYSITLAGYYDNTKSTLSGTFTVSNGLT